MPDVVILAGGKGTRLAGEVPNTQKVLAPVSGRPFISYLLDDLEKQGQRRVIVSAGYLADQIDQYLATQRTRNLELICIREERPLGTAGAVRHALSQIKTESVLVLNGDTHCRFDLSALELFHQRKKAKATLVATQVPDTRRYGLLKIGLDDRVEEFLEKNGNTTQGYVSAGVLLIARQEIEKLLPETELSLEQNLLPGLCGRGLYAFCGDFPFLDMGTPESYRQGQEYFRILPQ